ncbi:class I SAM-dependent methyltransferase [Lutibacter sp. HS1-25]|uniref:class I SAM-dependent methyltransferase n=1 Tax=Lutibacter sp. HS1-25 TaxID=2485000 RepID=UPI001011E38F|nr:class I SAM-dependent methyltransferase [Lutibacter sp. HS1-25]RXP44546.1 class I SAM-dependent methyltransferase [Lutibacter sp. HS1-25]
MSFYQQIAPYYHHIFKINVSQVDFIRLKIPENNGEVLDVGCGIGTLSLELGNYYKRIYGIDMDAEMIRVALKQKGDQLKSIEFKQISMLKLAATFDKSALDGIVCFGNTLVHLNSLDEIADFLQQAKHVVKPAGKLLLQIVNYDKIIEQNIKELPLVANDEITFERNYIYHKSENKMDFNTRLTVKSTDEIIENSIELLPVLKKELALLLKTAGFNNCNYYGNFNQELYTVDSMALIVEAW